MWNENLNIGRWSFLRSAFGVGESVTEPSLFPASHRALFFPILVITSLLCFSIFISVYAFIYLVGASTTQSSKSVSTVAVLPRRTSSHPDSVLPDSKGCEVE